MTILYITRNGSAGYILQLCGAIATLTNSVQEYDEGVFCVGV